MGVPGDATERALSPEDAGGDGGDGPREPSSRTSSRFDESTRRVLATEVAKATAPTPTPSASMPAGGLSGPMAAPGVSPYAAILKDPARMGLVLLGKASDGELARAQVEAMRHIVAALLVEVEALRGAVAALTAAGPGGATTAGETSTSDAYIRAYRDAALTLRDGSGVTSGLEKLVARLFETGSPLTTGAHAEGPLYEDAMLGRLGLHADALAAHRMEAAEGETRE